MKTGAGDREMELGFVSNALVMFMLYWDDVSLIWFVVVSVSPVQAFIDNIVASFCYMSLMIQILVLV